jgi:outer membrane biosynthesis protein TonB
MMIAAQDRRRWSMAPALLAAAALHLGLLLILTLTQSPGTAGLGAAVPITLVARGPTTDSRPAEAAPVTQSAQTEAPVAAPVAPSPPPPAPARPDRAPPTPKAKSPPPTPTPKATPDRKPPRPAPPRQAAPDTFSLDALAANIARTTRTSRPRPGFANRGPARAETAPQARVDAGQGVSQSDIAGLAQLLQRLWNPNCDAGESGTVIVSVRLAIDGEGHVGALSVTGPGAGSSDPVIVTATRRARDAIHQAEPFAAPFRNQTFPVNFDARKACAQR